MNGSSLTLGLVGALAVGAALGRRGSRSTAPLRALGYTDAEIARAIAAAGQGPTALMRGDTQTAGPTRQGAYEGIDFGPPAEVREEALRGLRLRKVNERNGKRVDPRTGAGPGGWWIGVGRAIQLATLPAIPPREILRMRNYFRRHAVDTKAKGFGNEDRPTPGFVAWLLWGGHEGRAWALEIARAMDAQDAEARNGSVNVNPLLGPRVSLGGRFAVRVKSDFSGLLLKLYEGPTRVGGILAYWELSTRSMNEGPCAADLRTLGMGDRSPILNVYKTEILPSHRGKGLGVAMYEALMAAAFDAKGPFFFVPSLCGGNIGCTSTDARRVWTSLAKRYPSSGWVIRVDARPTAQIR